MIKSVYSRLLAIIHFVGLLMRYGWKVGELSNLKPTAVLLVGHDNDRGYTWQGKRYAQLLDSVNELLYEIDIGTLTLATPYSREIGARAFGNVLAVNGCFARIQLAVKFNKIIGRYCATQDDPVVNGWLRILDRIKPSAIIGIEPSRELCIAARLLGITVAELQHGLLSDSTAEYSPEYRTRNNQSGWPDYLLCWDNGSAKWMEHQSNGRVSTKIIGNPWLLRFMYPKKSDRLVSEVADHRLDVDGGRPMILVSCQWAHELCEHHHPIGIPRPLLDVIKDKRLNYSWLLRLHPVQMQAGAKQKVLKHLAAEFQGCRNVSWEPWSSLPLPPVLKMVDLHITSHSAVAIEAEYFRVKTALLLEDMHMLNKFFSNQISRGSADIVHAEPTKIISWIEENSNNKTLRNVDYISIDRTSLDDFVASIAKNVAERAKIAVPV